MHNLDVAVGEQVTEVAEDGAEDSVCVEVEGSPLAKEEEEEGLEERGDGVEEGREVWQGRGGRG